MMTGFTRILIVLGFLRQAIGTPTMPPNQILVGISIFLTIFVMAPTFSRSTRRALQPYLNEKITGQQAIDSAPSRCVDVHAQADRLLELELFVKLSREEAPKTRTTCRSRR